MNPDDVPVAEDSPETREIVVPLYAEEVSVSKRVRESRVQVSRVTREQEQLVDELLAHEHVEIDRVPIGQPVDTMPAIREEDGTIIVPVVEEVLTIERRLILKEEVRIRKVRDVERHQESVSVRKQDAIITRLPIEEAAAAKAAAVGLIGPEKEE